MLLLLDGKREYSAIFAVQQTSFGGIEEKFEGMSLTALTVFCSYRDIDQHDPRIGGKVPEVGVVDPN